jgi:hypothetical protein
MSQKINVARLFLIRKPDGRRFTSAVGPVGEERALCEVLVLEQDGVGELRIPSTGERTFPYDLQGQSVEEVAKKLLADEETKYGTSRNAG